MKKVLVTGVTGQDGSYMADYLLEHTDHLVYGMVRRTAKPDYGNIEKALKSPRFRLVVGDLSDSPSLDELVKTIQPDYFINLAAQSFVGSSWVIPEQTFDIDAVAIIRCLEAIRKHAPACRFYNAGSSEEFGDVQYSPQDMKHPLRARSPYGAAKIAARQLVKVYRESYGLYAVQGLLFNHESERRGEEFVTRKITMGVARIAKAIREGQSFEPIELGNLDSKRDWSHAEDFVDGIWRMLNQEQYQDLYRSDEWHTHCEAHRLSIGSMGLANMGETERNAHETRKVEEARLFAVKHLKEYLLSSNETHSVREFVEKAFATAIIRGEWEFPRNGQRNPEEEVFTWVGGSKPYQLVRINPSFYRPAEVSLLHGDSSDARRELGWAPKVSFDELVKRMVVNDLKKVGL